MRVAYLAASLSHNYGGVYESARRLAQTLHERHGDEVHVFGLEDDATQEDLPSWRPLKATVFPIWGPRAFGYSPRLRPALDACQADVAHAHGIWAYPTLAAAGWAAARRKPYLVSTHGMLDEWALEHSRWKKWIARIAYANRGQRGAACLHAVTKAEVDAIRRCGHLNPICLIPNGVDLPGRGGRARAPAPPGFAHGRCILLYIGRLHPQKGLMALLTGFQVALRRAGARAVDWDLVIAGWDQGGHGGELKELARRLGIDARVHFIGPLFGDAKAAAYEACAAFALPSLSEGLPMAVLEAWAYGKPVVMSPQSNLPEGYQAGAAIRVETDPQSIAAGLETLLAMSDADRAEMGQRGLRLVVDHFTWPKVAAEMHAVYEWLVGGGPPPSSVPFR